MWICIAPHCEHTSKALRYGTHSQGISQFYLQTPRLSANGMNHTCLCLPNQSIITYSLQSGHRVLAVKTVTLLQSVYNIC